MLLASAYVGICGSDLHVLQGKHPWFKPPVITGHELAAVVEKIGPDITNLLPAIMLFSIRYSPVEPAGGAAWDRLTPAKRTG